MAATDQLETKLKEVFVDKAPKLPDGGKKFIVDFAPWVTLIGGILMLFSALNLWHWAHVANVVNDYARSLCNTYATDSCKNLADTRLNAWIWLTLAVTLVEGVMYLMAFPGLRDRKKSGWNLVFYVAIINVVLAVFSLFNGYGGAGNFIGGLIGSAIGFYLLFQVRSAYLGKPAAAPKTDSPVK